MIRKIEVGMKLSLQNPVNHNRYTVTVLEVPTDEAGLVKILLASGKERQLTFAALKNAERVKETKEKRVSAMSVAMGVLSSENKPMTVAEISAATLKAGYVLPREGKTFSNTMSSRLNAAAAKGQIKKLANGVFAANSCTLEYVKPENQIEKKQRLNAEAADAVRAELGAALAGETADVPPEAVPTEA